MENGRMDEKKKGNKKKKPAVSLEEKRKKITGAAVADLEKLKKLLSKQEIQKSSLDFFKILRRFFTDFYVIKYRFTYEELIAELGRRRMKQKLYEEVSAFISKLMEIEYGQAQLKKDELSELIAGFRSFVHRLSQISAKKSGKEARKSILSLLIELFQLIKRALNKPASERLEKIIATAMDSLAKGELFAARSLYRKISPLFLKLKETEKETFYPKVMELYGRITSESKDYSAGSEL